MTDLTRGLTHADLVVQGDKLPQGFDGSGVIIGVVDTGFDFLHPAFLNNQLHSRIVCVWDQVASNGNLSDYGYGSVYEGRSEVENVKHDLSTDTHGTHVLGIASGSIWGKYGGIAPNAELAVVSTNKSEQGIIDGVDFLFHKMVPSSTFYVRYLQKALNYDVPHYLQQYTTRHLVYP